MKTIERLNQVNAPLVIYEIMSEAFRPYGRLLSHFNTTELIKYAKDTTSVPDQGNHYVPSVTELEDFGVIHQIQDQVYGQLPIQAGFCVGQNTGLTGLEYHQGSEVVIAATDCIHLVGRVQDIEDNSYDSANVQVFFQPKNTVVQIYSTTLHYAPCKVDSEGYLTIVILPAGTNMPLEAGEGSRENLLLTKKNKFLMVHSTQMEKIAAGVHPGLRGKLLNISPI
ncbi:DUF4867 family protein [Paenibacillus polymyxa]|uniref:DUF4867 family protein n=1 Tax=Paenibacillus polymyxa TaxID=1406 RepID=UPI002AB4A344|nr:DUF4867 family protein [Paenibacillus polymyxa]MDY7991330.1 DUF4867 family protein [Paenibacillus polymyxa]MDY8117770.1 DUF4867 family protein [Paenibacillus polymyxa]